jgi:uncharacterized protein YkwD
VDDPPVLPRAAVTPARVPAGPPRLADPPAAAAPSRGDRALVVLVVGLAGALLLALGIAAAGPTTRGPDLAAATFMLELVNADRAENGLAPLAPAEDVAAVARAWSAQMAGGAGLEHNPAYADEICCWSVVTENVAWSEPHRFWRPGDPVARVTRELQAALLASPGHRANLLDPGVDQVGIGVHVDADGAVWITQNFRAHRAP